MYWNVQKYAFVRLVYLESRRLEFTFWDAAAFQKFISSSTPSIFWNAVYDYIHNICSLILQGSFQVLWYDFSVWWCATFVGQHHARPAQGRITFIPEAGSTEIETIQLWLSPCSKHRKQVCLNISLDRPQYTNLLFFFEGHIGLT